MMAQEAPLIFHCGEAELLGIVHEGSTTTTAGIVIVVGGPQYRVGSHRQFVQIARALAAAGYAVLRFDYRGMGDSDAPERTFEDVADDIRSAIDAFCRAEPAVRDIVLLGLCDAASASLMYCQRDQRVKGLLLLNPWVRTLGGEADSYVRYYYGRRLMQASFWRKVLAGEYRLADSTRDFLRKLGTARRAGRDTQGGFIAAMCRGLQTFAHPVCFLISGRDLTAREFTTLVEKSAAWRAAMSRASVVTHVLPGADHTLSAAGDLREACRLACDWLKRHFPPAER